ncbi:MAG: right-handed parallel beta-helix repeat-containing protein [Sedimentisphaerales bacterium]
MRLEISIVFVVLCAAVAAEGNVIYVDDNAIGANDGTSWADAYNYLQDALADANMAPKPVEIRVAQGIYTPDQGAGITRGDRGAAFQLINGVTVLGGFAGVGVIEPDVRYIEAYKTILSGDLAGDDADVDDPDELSGHPTRAENSSSVVSGGDTDQTAVLDGVTIIAGDTGMSNWQGSPSVANCTFTNARTGIFNLRNSQILTNCTFKGHWFQAIRQSEGSLTVINCMFTGNTGGAIDSSARSDLTLRDCTFIANEVRRLAMINCSFQENLRMYNCQFRKNVAISVAGVRAEIEGEFIAESCTFAGNVGVSIDHNRGRMVISNCVFAGNRGCAINSHNRYVNIENCTFSGNSADRGGSVLDTWHGSKVSNCIFWGNNSPAIVDLRDETVMNYCNVEGGWSGDGNIDVDPYFVLLGYWDQNGTLDDTADDFWVDGDYHLQSQAGHWDQQSQTWAQDDVTSPCIDTGDPNSPIGTEPFPNGGRVNMGAYGAGDKASKSYFGKPVCEVIIAGDINGDCVVDSEDEAILISHWMMQGDDFINKLPTVRVLEPQDGDRIAWPGSTTFRAEANDTDGQVDDVMFWIKHQTDGGYTSYGLSADNGADGWEREYTWKEDLPSGTWTVWAEATDNEGQIGFSPEITVTLHRP